MTRLAERYLTGNSGCIVALVIGVTTIRLVAGGFSLLTGADLNLADEWGVFLFQAVLVAIPFGALATARQSALAAWLTAAALTALFWGLYVADALIRQGRGGADIGLGLVLLLSPLLITGAAFAAGAVARRLQ